MYDLPDAPAVLSSIADVFTAFGALAVAGVTFWGINNWKRERGSDLAKAMASELYQLREDLHRVRVEFIMGSDRELDPGLDVKKGLTQDLQMLRWRHAQAELDDLRALCAEADLRWPGAVREALEAIEGMNRGLLQNVNRYHRRDARRVDLGRKQNGDRDRFDFAVFYAAKLKALGSRDDAIGKEIDAAFEAMTEFLRKHI